MSLLLPIALLIAAIIHLMPLVGVLGSVKLKSLYGIDFSDSNVLILMQHRAVLFGLLGTLLVLAIFKAELRWLAVIGALISAVSFLLIAVINGNYNDSLKTVLIADIVAIIALTFAVVLMWIAPE